MLMESLLYISYFLYTLQIEIIYIARSNLASPSSSPACLDAVAANINLSWSNGWEKNGRK